MIVKIKNSQASNAKHNNTKIDFASKYYIYIHYTFKLWISLQNVIIEISILMLITKLCDIHLIKVEV